MWSFRINIKMCSCVCSVLARRCFGRRRLRRHGWREWAGLWGVRVGGAEEDQSYGFTGGRLQRYECSPWLSFKAVHWRLDDSLTLFSPATAFSHSSPRLAFSPFCPSASLLRCSSIIHRCCPPRVPLPPWDRSWTRPGSCNGGSAAAARPEVSSGVAPHNPLCEEKQNTFSWAIDPLVAALCACVRSQKCNYRTGLESWSLESTAAAPRHNTLGVQPLRSP